MTNDKIRTNKPEAMICIKNIYKTFGNKKTGELSVLRGISCDIQKGERVVIIGPSGSGKIGRASCRERVCLSV